jgi:transcriptional regulator with XRE-family HTH domain
MTNVESLEKRKAIALEIKKIREEKGLSQLELAEKMGVARSTISKIENGEFAFSVDYLIKLSENLNFTIKLEKNEH